MTEKLHNHESASKPNRILVTMPYGIGDAVYIGLAAVDEINRWHPGAQIDVLCMPVQRELFTHDPRVHEVIETNKLMWQTPRKEFLFKLWERDHQLLNLADTIRQSKYDAVFPGCGNFGFLRRLGYPLMLPKARDIYQDLRTIRAFGDAPATRRVRDAVRKHFHQPLMSPDCQNYSSIPLYIPPATYLDGQLKASEIRRNSDSPLLIVTPDSSSALTRPPTNLLAAGIKGAISQIPDLSVHILPSYTDQDASDRLANQLSGLSCRISQAPAHPKPLLLSITALLDQADVVLTPDTGIMHLSLAHKIITDGNGCEPGNTTRTVSLWGATNPGLYGWGGGKMVILGRGRPEQRRIKPGFLKEGCQPIPGIDYFDHIKPSEITNAIINSLQPVNGCV